MGRNLWQMAGAIGFGLLVGAGALLAARPWGESWEYRALALGMRLRGPRPVPANLWIVAVDDRAIGEGAKGHPDLAGMEQFPWQRTVYARAIAKMLEAGAAAVAVDLVFEGESPVDAEFARILAPYRDRVILAASNEISEGVEAQFERLVQPSPSLGPLRQGVVNFAVVPGLETVFHLGNTYAAQVSEGTKRSFAEETLRAAGLELPPPAGDLIHFYGPGGTWRAAGQQVSFYQILDRQNWESALLDSGQKLQGAIVLIGATSEGLQDIQPSAWGRMPGVEIHANAVATLLEQRALRRRGTGWGLVLGLGSLAAVGLYVGRGKPVRQFLGGWALAGLWSAAAFFALAQGGVWLPVAWPVATLTLGSLWVLLCGAIADRQDKLALRRTLERYVAAPIVNQILNQPEDYRALLGGKKIQAAVLFSDVRSFTTLSSLLPPDKMVAQLNTYFGAMVDVILECQGTLDKFIGDAIMAEFGSPVSQGPKQDALNAVRAALEMRSALAALRVAWQQADELPFFNGIGINYGEIVVGNIGSPKRLEFAAIGDTVNVASRIESVTKDLGSDIVISESLYTLVADEIEAVDLGEIQLKGRIGAVKLYGVIGWKGCDRALFEGIQRQMQEFSTAIRTRMAGSPAP